MGKRQVLQSIIKFLFDHLTHTEFSGLEYLPETGGVLIATNHISRIDIPALFLTPNRSDITALVADKYKRYPFFWVIISVAEGIWLDRSKADFTAFRTAIDFLKQGGALGISPEGTRSESGQLIEGKSGTVLLATRANVPIVPVGLSGTDRAIPSLLRLRKAHVRINFGPAFRLPPIPRENREAAMQQYTDEVMARIAVLLPEEQRGFYRDHPRVQELLREQPPPRPAGGDAQAALSS